MKVGIVIIGDEILSAEVAEANIAYMLPHLNEWGAQVSLCAIVPDDVDTVVRHLRFYREEADFLVLTGGIGPTPDDITRDAVAAAAGVPLVVHPDAVAALKGYYGDRLDEARMVMARVPEGAELIPNPLSGAPGFCIGRMAAFPGIPLLLREMFGWVRPRVQGKRKSRVILFTTAPESAFAAIMGEAMAAFPDVGIGSYPMIEEKYRARVVFRADDPSRARDCADRFQASLERTGWKISKRVEEGPGS